MNLEKQKKDIKDALERFYELSKQSKTFIWEVDKNSMYTYISDNVKDVIGYSVDELVNKKKVYDLHPKEGLTVFKKSVFKILKNKEEVNALENPIVAKNGEIVWVLSSGIPILDDKGDLTGFRGSDMDISRIKESEKELAFQKEQYKTMISNLVGVAYRCLHDKDWTMLLMSDFIKKLTGYPAQDFIKNNKRSYESVIYAKDKKYVAEKIEKAIKDKKSWDIEYRIQNKNKKIIWVKETGTAIRDEKGDIKFLDGIIVDIDAIKKAETELLEEKVELEKFKMAVQGASDHVVVTDKEGKILFANDSVARITGYEIDKIIGQKAGSKENWGGYMDKGVYDKLWKTITVDKKSFEGEFKNKRKNGEPYTAKASVSPILNARGEVEFFIGIERDITKEKEVDRMKTEFISLASHQLRTPLSGMKWFSEMLLSGDAGKLNEEQADFISKIKEANERMIKLVNALLNISRIESGRIIVEPKPTNIRKLIEDLLFELKPRVEEKNINIIISINEKIGEINIDEKLIGEVYNNLLTNAIKYTPKDGEITLMVSKKDNEIVSQISDTGYGIPKEEQERIFEKFYRGSNIMKVDTDGNGLGMYLVKAVVESSGGRIWFESEENKGSTFWFTIPTSGMKKKEGVVRIGS